MTHSHDLDAEILSVLAKKSLASLGLIGSESKWNRFQHRLLKLGLSQEEVEKIKCPIGIGDLGKHPKAIAVSLAAELFQKVKACTIPSSYSQRVNLNELELQSH